MRFRKPFYRESRRLWYVQLDGRQINLGSDEKEAWRRYHEMMATRGRDVPVTPVDTTMAVVVIDLFLGWVERHKARRTYEWYQRHCQTFAKSIPVALKVVELKSLHLTRLCDRHNDWSPTTRHGLCRAVQRAFNWAQRQGMIDRSPLGMVEKPEPQDRDVLVSPDQYEEILGMVKDGFRDLIVMAWESGIRPQEVRAVEARHLDFQHGRIIFPPKEAKGKKLPRVVYLTPEAEAIVRRLAEKWPDGAIFRNADGKPWTRFAINCAFIRLEKKIGRKVHLGAFRKSWATEALKNGTDPITAAFLLGHSNTNMLARTYAKIQQNPEYMRNAMKRAKGDLDV